MKGCGEGGGAGGGGLDGAGGRLICVGAQVMGCAQWANLDGIDGTPTGRLLRASTGAKSQSECQHGATERSKFNFSQKM